MFCQTWKPNGENCPETNLKDGNGRSVCYHPNGQKWWDENWKDGELDGLLINYIEDGKEILRETYKEGKLV